MSSVVHSLPPVQSPPQQELGIQKNQAFHQLIQANATESNRLNRFARFLSSQESLNIAEAPILQAAKGIYDFYIKNQSTLLDGNKNAGIICDDSPEADAKYWLALCIQRSVGVYGLESLALGVARLPDEEIQPSDKDRLDSEGKVQEVFLGCRRDMILFGVQDDDAIIHARSGSSGDELIYDPTSQEESKKRIAALVRHKFRV